MFVGLLECECLQHYRWIFCPTQNDNLPYSIRVSALNEPLNPALAHYLISQLELANNATNNKVLQLKMAHGADIWDGSILTC